MSTEPSKFAENQFESGTRNRNPLMGEVLDSTVPRITVAAVTTVAAWETAATDLRSASLPVPAALEDAEDAEGFPEGYSGAFTT